MRRTLGDRIETRGRGCGIDLELGSIQGGAACVVAPAEDAGAVEETGGTSGDRLPNDDETAARIHRQERVRLPARNRGVDQELIALCHATGIVATRENAVGIATAVARPGNDEVPARVHDRRGLYLVAYRGRINQKLGTLRYRVGVIALRKDAVAAAILALASPNNDRLARGIHADRWKELVAWREGIHLVLRSGRNSGQEQREI